MNFQFGEKEEKLRREIREFVKEHIPQGHGAGAFSEEHDDEKWAFSMSIAKKLAQKGWLTMSWPKEYGGKGASIWERVVYSEEVGYWGIPGTSMGVSGVNWIGPSLMLFGTDEQKKKYLPPIAAGDPEGVWCTGYSEPDSGSDFASLQTRAEKVGNEYIINGQKVWTSAGHRARYCWLAVRTDPTVKKKHHGISIIIVDMQSEGITVRPLKNVVGYHYFNEIFFNDVKVPADNLVGEENKGWYQLMQALAFERGIALGMSASCRRILDELIHYCNESGTIKKPEIRQMLADAATEVEVLRMLALESAWKTSKEEMVIHEPSRDKAFNDLIFEKISKIGTEILGPFCQLDPLYGDTLWKKIRGAMEQLYWAAPAIAIGAGTTDTMKNIVGQFGLDLPKSY